MSVPILDSKLNLITAPHFLLYKSFFFGLPFLSHFGLENFQDLFVNIWNELVTKLSSTHRASFITIDDHSVLALDAEDMLTGECDWFSTECIADSTFIVLFLQI